RLEVLGQGRLVVERQGGAGGKKGSHPPEVTTGESPSSQLLTVLVVQETAHLASELDTCQKVRRGAVGELPDEEDLSSTQASHGGPQAASAITPESSEWLRTAATLTPEMGGVRGHPLSVRAKASRESTQRSARRLCGQPPSTPAEA